MRQNHLLGADLGHPLSPGELSHLHDHGGNAAGRPVRLEKGCPASTLSRHPTKAPQGPSSISGYKPPQPNTQATRSLVQGVGRPFVEQKRETQTNIGKGMKTTALFFPPSTTSSPSVASKSRAILLPAWTSHPHHGGLPTQPPQGGGGSHQLPLSYHLH